VHGPRIKAWRAPLPAEARERIQAVVPEAPAQHLVTLVQQARNAEGAERVRWATLVNEALAARTEGCGETLVQFLDEGAFDRLVDEDGVGCRRRAVEAVLALGWPWAMHLTPFDVDLLRARRRLPIGAAVAIGMLAGTLLFAWYIGA
jgi:hypothetical protein